MLGVQCALVSQVMISLDDMRFFALIAKSASLAEVARALDVTPPAVTQRLQQLEARLGVRLVNRSTRRLSLTTEGALLTERSQNIISEIDDITEILSSRAETVSGHLRIAAPFGFGRRYVAPAAAAFRKEHPSTSVTLELSHDPLQFASDTWDVVIHIGQLKDSQRSMMKLAPNDRVLCASPDYLARHGQPERPDDLRHFDCLALRENEEDVTLWRLTSATEKTVSVRVQPAISSNDGEVVRSWGLAGLGIILRSEWDVADELRAGTLVRVLPDWQPGSADIVALFATRQGRTARATRFIEVLRRCLTPVPWRS
jgi:DNA-binding transcriptional LysR family regulator